MRLNREPESVWASRASSKSKHKGMGIQEDSEIMSSDKDEDKEYDSLNSQPSTWIHETLS